MGHKGFNEEHSVLHHLSCIAPHMLRLRNQDNLIEFVLHELCCNKGFNVEKAAYFVDNPDFNCLRGIAGFSRFEAYPDHNSIWDNPDSFSLHMGQAPFNQKVRGIAAHSVRKSPAHEVDFLRELAGNLGLKDYSFYSWDMKHDNHGIFLFEGFNNEHTLYEHLKNGTSLLSFCPLF